MPPPAVSFYLLLKNLKATHTIQHHNKVKYNILLIPKMLLVKLYLTQNNYNLAPGTEHVSLPGQTCLQRQKVPSIIYVKLSLEGLSESEVSANFVICIS